MQTEYLRPSFEPLREEHALGLYLAFLEEEIYRYIPESPPSSLAFTCREGLEHVVDGVHGPVPVAEHWELASNVLFGRPVQAWVQNRTLPRGQNYFVKFEIFESLKGDLEGEVVIRLVPEASLFLMVGVNYVVTLFDGGKLDLCSMIFEMPNFVDTMDELKIHADRTDYSRSNETLRELLRVVAESP